tara:strand:+ start:1790 stop:2635 length:846 start_codon:yes stop_codon:yes gene_type:complete
LAITGVVFVLLVLLTAWSLVGYLTAPRHHDVGPPPRNMPVQDVAFESDSGSRIHGWYVTRTENAPAILLVHGLHGDRTWMMTRAGILLNAGYAILAIDLSAHGESEGEGITFGWREHHDVTAAVRFLREIKGHERVGAIGESLGGASIVMGDRSQRLDAVVLEMVFRDLDSAVHDRVARWLGSWGASIIAPLLTVQGPRRMGFAADDLRPIERIGDLDAPVFVMGGDRDAHTPTEDTRALYEAARGPKELWLVPGAIHTNLQAQARDAYAERVLAFFAEHL